MRKVVSMDSVSMVGARLALGTGWDCVLDCGCGSRLLRPVAPTASPAPTARPTATPAEQAAGRFDGRMALSFVEEQVAIGPRPAGSEGGKRTADYIVSQLEEWGWKTEVQEFTYRGVSCRNVVGKAGTGPIALFGAHYDTRKWADKDPDERLRTEPVVGANDGASGVAVLLELGSHAGHRKSEERSLAHLFRCGRQWWLRRLGIQRRV